MKPIPCNKNEVIAFRECTLRISLFASCVYLIVRCGLTYAQEPARSFEEQSPRVVSYKTEHPSLSRFRTLSFDQFSTGEGLSNPDVRSIVRDSIGFMWFGTSNDLNRFDGYVMNVYKPAESDPTSLSDADIRSLHVDRTGVLWVGTYAGGLLRYNHHEDTFKRIVLQYSEPGSRNIGSICEDHDGVLWIGSEHGLHRLDPRTEEYVDYHHDTTNVNSLSDNVIMDVVTEGHEEAIWVATLNGGLNRFEPDSNIWTRFNHDPRKSHGLPQTHLSVLHMDHD